MGYLNKVKEPFKNYKYSIAVIFLIVFSSYYTIIHYKLYQYEKSVIYWDVLSYYAYLPATFIYDDVTLDFIGKDNTNWGDKFWPSRTPINKNVIKTSMGLSYLYSPFFFLAHVYAKNSTFKADGFSKPYKKFLLLGMLFYYLIGLYYVLLLLKKWFKDKIIAITLFCIGFGTNIYWYSAYHSMPMPHVFNFTLFALFLYYCIKWLENQTYSLTIFLGLLLGLISLIRPTNIILVLFILTWGITSKSEFYKRVQLLLQKFYKILLMIISLLAIWIPQFLYWKKVSGSYFYFSYGADEGFFFLKPEIINGLFSYRNGWLVYTPIMIFALYGIYLLKKKLNIAYLPILIFTILNIYIILSWWCWWYVGYGNRAFIDSYAILSIPLAAFIDYSLNLSKIKKYLILVIAFILILLNQLKCYQHKLNIITSDSNNKNLYWYSFLDLEKTDTLKYLTLTPDYDKARKGITFVKSNYEFKPESPFTLRYNEISCNCEVVDWNKQRFLSDNIDYYKFYCGNHQSTEKSHSGKQSIKLTKESPYGLEFIIQKIKMKTTLELSVWRYSSSGLIVASDAGSNLFYQASSKSIEKDENGWEKVVLNIVIPDNMQDRDLKIYVWNKELKEAVYFDDISIKYVER